MHNDFLLKDIIRLGFELLLLSNWKWALCLHDDNWPSGWFVFSKHILLPNGVLVHHIEGERVEAGGQMKGIFFPPERIQVLPDGRCPGWSTAENLSFLKKHRCQASTITQYKRFTRITCAFQAEFVNLPGYRKHSNDCKWRWWKTINRFTPFLKGTLGHFHFKRHKAF